MELTCFIIGTTQRADQTIHGGGRVGGMGARGEGGGDGGGEFSPTIFNDEKISKNI